MCVQMYVWPASAAVDWQCNPSCTPSAASSLLHEICIACNNNTPQQFDGCRSERPDFLKIKKCWPWKILRFREDFCISPNPKGRRVEVCKMKRFPFKKVLDGLTSGSSNSTPKGETEIAETLSSDNFTVCKVGASRCPVHVSPSLYHSVILSVSVIDSLSKKHQFANSCCAFWDLYSGFYEPIFSCVHFWRRDNRVFVWGKIL